jgi:hypothetical protein
MDSPASLSARSSDGTEQVLVALGTALPASSKIMFATTRAGQDVIEVELLEDGEHRLANARFPLPRGLPANCWIPIFVSVGIDLLVRAEARENLRRLRVDAEFDTDGQAAKSFRV